jgi:hypothetical protein
VIDTVGYRGFRVRETVGFVHGHGSGGDTLRREVEEGEAGHLHLEFGHLAVCACRVQSLNSFYLLLAVCAGNSACILCMLGDFTFLELVFGEMLRSGCRREAEAVCSRLFSCAFVIIM